MINSKELAGFTDMTNKEVQDIIKIGDICICRKDGVLREFRGYERCEWQSEKGYSACGVCKGRMIFGSINEISVSCHSHTGANDENHSDVEIIKHKILLPEELFEI